MNTRTEVSGALTRKERIRTILIGAIVSGLLSMAIVIATAKAGISPGVSPLVVLFGWIGFGRLLGARLRPFLSLLQVTGSGGVAVSAGVVFTAPIIQVLARQQGLDIPPVDVSVLILASIVGSFIGWGFVGLATERFLTDPKLPAPEAVACDRLIDTAAENPEDRPPVWTSLVPGLLLGLVLKACHSLKLLPEKLGRVSLPGWGEGGIALPIPTSAVYLGIGALLTLPTALMIFGGSLIHGGVTSYASAHGLPSETFRWVGGAAMCVAVIWSLGRYALEGRRAGSAAAAEVDLELIRIPPDVRRRQLASIGIGAIGLLLLMGMLGASALQLLVVGVVALVLAAFLSGLGALLSLQVGASASPVSGTTFMGMLVLSLTALGIGLEGMDGIALLVPVVVATCVAVCAANDASQDYKTVQLSRFRVSDHLIGQIVGLLVGALSVPYALQIAHAQLGGLGSAEIPCPQAAFFGTVLASLFLDSAIPWGPVGVGAGLGVLAVIIEEVGRRKGALLSSLALAVGIYLPADIGCGILLGALARFIATRRISHSTHPGILTASGLITGYAFTALILGISMSAGWSGKLALPEGYSTDAGLPWVIGAVLLVATLTCVTLNYASRWRPRSTGADRAGSDVEAGDA
ncbi:MAG: hypothetical protein ACO4BJ_01420 [Planctomycetota bacterium]|jgi:putative OPT family oligopeptide transporter